MPSSARGGAEDALDRTEAAWVDRYPIVIQAWRNKWEHLSAYFKYPEPIRRVIYTTNSIEAVHRQLRNLTKTKGGFPNDMSLLKFLYLGIQNASKKWTMPLQSWNLTLSQLVIYFEGRLDAALDLRSVWSYIATTGASVGSAPIAQVRQRTPVANKRSALACFN